ncbi:hypothetical protein BZA05DRAFT_7102 [Tricharina praecox]|uniref:uncharacterized protein n=1 Tax=Tricharina praecox TaxID=43433 RepID=UPI00221E8080|nr:uncharacterized protein BZA05DRAFT_7102 [Tricharina praecox]KAI5858551.1 hypothetical protein BZA05DRAFT_7102 [Tricharina praecox]
MTSTNSSDPSSVIANGTAQLVPNVFSQLRLGRTSAISNAAQFLLVAAMVSSILRVLSRRRAKAQFKLDDVCAVVAAVLLLANTVICVEFHYLGMASFSFNGASTPEREAERQTKVVEAFKLSFAFEVLYLLSIFLVKFSMLFLYSRFAHQTKGILLYLRITQGICAATFIVCILSLFLSCNPISNYWSVTPSSYHCMHRTLLTYASGISNIVTNTLVLLVPIPLLLRITLTRSQKIGLSILYFFGASVILTSALRFVTQLLNVSNQQAMGWSQMEVSLALLLASAPMAIKLLFLPLLDVDTEREEILNARRGAPSADLDTPTFMKKLMGERDALEGGRSPWLVRPMSPAILV